MDHQFIGSVLGDYQIEECIGEGGMGVVYRARQLTLDRAVAIKILRKELCTEPENIDRFLREARAVAHLNHLNIIQIFDAGVADHIYFFVMEYVDGENLAQLIQKKGRLEELQSLQILQQAAEGLAFAHSMGIIHRDVKPENIMLTKNGITKVGDLGLAKWKPNEFDISLSASGMTLGTPYYISPEQIRGWKDIDDRADIYSLGMTLYHLLSGNPAFSKGSANEIMSQHFSKEIPSLQLTVPYLSQPTLNLVTTMTAKKREKRFQKMSEVADTIAGILGQKGHPPSHTMRKGFFSQRSLSSSNLWNRILPAFAKKPPSRGRGTVDDSPR